MKSWERDPNLIRLVSLQGEKETPVKQGPGERPCEDKTWGWPSTGHPCQEPPLPVPKLWTSSLQNCGRIHFCSSHPVQGILLWQLDQTNIVENCGCLSSWQWLRSDRSWNKYFLNIVIQQSLIKVRVHLRILTMHFYLILTITNVVGSIIIIL